MKKWSLISVLLLLALKAFGMGAAVVAISDKQWVFTLSAGLIAVIAYALSPRRAGDALAATRGWLERNDRQVLAAASLIFGLFFLYKGITGLTG